MNKNRGLYLEGIIILTFTLTICTMLIAVLGILPSIWGIIIGSLFGIIYGSFFCWYASIKLENKELKSQSRHIKRLIIGHSIPILLTLFFFDIVTKIMLLILIIIGGFIIFSTFRNIEESERNHIHFIVKTIIMPYTKPLIIWIFLIFSIFIYGNTLRNNPNGVFLDEYFVSKQIQTINPILKEFTPDLNLNGSIRNYLEPQIEEQKIGHEPINKDKIIMEKVNELSIRFNIPLTPETTISQAFVSYINKFLGSWMNGPIWAIIVSFLLFLILSPFIGLYQIGLRICIPWIHKKALEYNFLNLYLKNLNKERFRL